jgi:hypothetical protein
VAKTSQESISRNRQLSGLSKRHDPAPLGYYHESSVKADRDFVIAAGAAGEVGYSDVDF